MRRLLHVLLLAVARFLQGCADFLTHLGERSRFAAETPDPGAFPVRTVQPPEDWVRRASPPPPAHWLRTVRARAPGFLREAGTRSVKSGDLVDPTSRRARDFAAPLSAPVSPGFDLKPAVRAASLLLPAQPPRVGGVRKPTPSRPVRIVTVVEETPRRKPEESRRSDEGPGQQSPLTAEGSGPEAMRGRIPPAVLKARSARHSTEEHPPDFPEVSLKAEEEGAWTPLLHPALASAALPPVPGSAGLPSLESPEGIPRPPAPDRPEFRSEREPSGSRSCEAAASAGAARWPELPVADLSDELDDARLLLRELRRQAELESEQRGMPWSA